MSVFLNFFFEIILFVFFLFFLNVEGEVILLLLYDLFEGLFVNFDLISFEVDNV